jgi:AcrR family transcriptional regulator
MGAVERTSMPAKPNPYTSSVWMRPPRSGGGQQPTLSRTQIVGAAIELLDAEGAAGLSMRRLGTRLGSGATSVYWYVANKDELLELAVDEVMGEIQVPEVGDVSWRAAASALTTQMHGMLIRHPWVLGLLGTRPNMGPNAMRMGDRLVALLVAAGFTGIDVSYASSLLTAHAIGSATAMAAFKNTIKGSDQTLGELFKTLEPHLERLAADHPNYQKWWHETVPSIDPDKVFTQSFEFGTERLLDGLEQWLASRPA